jgi:hypothetical protein
MAEGQRRANIPSTFDRLDDQFFSLGQDDSYYDDLNRLGPEVRDRVLRGLRDVALDLQLFQRALDEKVTGTSLLRSVSRATVLGQFHRMATGGVRLSRYEFSYAAPRPSRSNAPPLTLQFVVEPGSFPPTNIHVLIGRNIDVSRPRPTSSLAKINKIVANLRKRLRLSCSLWQNTLRGT